MTRRSYILLFLLSSLVSQQIALAADIEITTYVEGGLTIQLNGDWNSGINFNSTGFSYKSRNVAWNSFNNEDYISFVDDTNDIGFHLNLSVTDFRYSGNDPSQSDINASELEIIGKYENGSAGTIDLGYNDPNLTLSILPDSCASATTSNYVLHSDFSNSGENYSLTGSNSGQTIIETSINCLNLGHIRFDRLELTIPNGAAVGTYTSTFNFAISAGLS